MPRKKTRTRYGWTASVMTSFRALVEMGATPQEIADALGRSLNSVENKLKVLDGTHHRLGGLNFSPRYSAPAARPNDCRAHLTRIYEAHGSGFPILPIQYRRAA